MENAIGKSLIIAGACEWLRCLPYLAYEQRDFNGGVMTSNCRT
ncbi:hypothetical protein CGRA01v4_13202 [Colletotrichum graminicola]|nr:hypothetical protein CGRA01v4_13202 [Colletotrichum graminicola]